jgi:hypothetical protein
MTKKPTQNPHSNEKPMREKQGNFVKLRLIVYAHPLIEFPNKIPHNSKNSAFPPNLAKCQKPPKNVNF